MAEITEEHRRARRRRVLKAGRIQLDGGSAISCTVNNLSTTGAAISVSEPFRVPDSFILVLEMETTKHVCRVVWRHGKRIGVAFSMVRGESSAGASGR